MQKGYVYPWILDNVVESQNKKEVSQNISLIIVLILYLFDIQYVILGFMWLPKPKRNSSKNFGLLACIKDNPSV